MYVCSSYEKVVLSGDFNAQENECVFDSFLYQHDLTNLFKTRYLLQKPKKVKLYWIVFDKQSIKVSQ